MSLTVPSFRVWACSHAIFWARFSPESLSSEKANSLPRTWRGNLWFRRAQKRDYKTFFSITCCAKLGGKRAKKQLLLLVDLGCRFAAPNINVSHVKTMKHGQTTENEDCQAKKGEREILIVKQELLKSKRNSIKHCRSRTENFSPSIRAQTGRSRKSLRTTFHSLRSARRPRHIQFDILLIKRPPYDSVLIENDFSFRGAEWELKPLDRNLIFHFHEMGWIDFYSTSRKCCRSTGSVFAFTTVLSARQQRNEANRKHPIARERLREISLKQEHTSSREINFAAYSREDASSERIFAGLSFKSSSAMIYEQF